MSWIVKRIQEDDFGCEERPDDAKVKVLVTLADENGQERLIHVEDDWLYANGIDEGSSWPEGEIIDGRSIVAFGDGRSAKRILITQLIVPHSKKHIRSAFSCRISQSAVSSGSTGASKMNMGSWPERDRFCRPRSLTKY